MPEDTALKIAFKISAIVLVLLAITTAGAYLWFLRHAEELVHQFLLSESNGAIDLRTQRVSYRFKTHRLTLTGNDFVTRPDKDHAYSIRAQQIECSMGPLYQIIRERRLIIDSILVDAPFVGIERTTPGKRRNISLPEEMGRIYQLLDRSLNNLSIQTFQITNGSFRLDNSYDSIPPIDIYGINLRLEGLRGHDSTSLERFMLSDRLLVQTGPQSIRLPNGYHRLGFRSFRLDTREQIIELDSCRLSDLRKTGEGGHLDLRFDTLQFRNLDLSLLSRENMLKADSTRCINPVINISFETTKPTETSTASGRKRLQQNIESIVRQMTGHLEMGHIQVRNASVDLSLTRNGKKSSYQSAGSDFTIDELSIPPAESGPLRIGKFDFEIRNYTGYSADSMYAIRFDSIQLRDKTIALNRFSVRATSRNRESGWREITMKAFEMRNIFWPALLFEDRIQSSTTTLVEPSISLQSGSPAGARRKSKGAFFLALNGFRKNLQMDSLLIRNGSVTLETENGATLDMNGFNSGVDVRAFLSSNNPNDLIGSLNGFSFIDGVLTNGDERITLGAGRYSRQLQQLTLGEAAYRNLLDPLVITARGLVLGNAERTSDNRFKARSVSWEEADIRMDRSEKQIKNAKRSTPLLFGWEETRGRQTTLDIIAGETSVLTTVERLRTGPVSITSEGRPEIEDISLEGRNLRLELSRSRSRIGRYSLEDGQWSTLRDIELYFPVGDRRVQTSIPTLMLKADLGSFLAEKPIVDSLRLEDPLFRFERMAGNSSSTVKKIPDLKVGNLDIIRAVLPKDPIRFGEDLKLSGKIPYWRFHDLSVREGLLAIQMINIGWDSLRVEKGHTMISANNQGGRTAILTDLNINPATADRHIRWSTLLRRLDAAGLTIDDRTNATQGKVSTPWELENFSISSLKLGSEIPLDAKSFTNTQPALGLRAGLIRRSGENNLLKVKGIEWQQSTQMLRWIDLSMTPPLDKYNFTKTLQQQQDHISLRIGQGMADHPDLASFLKDGILHIRHLSADDAELSFFRDRTLPPKTGIIKPLPAGLLRRFKTPLIIDSLHIRNSTISYEEINDRTGKTGFVQLKKTNGRLLNLRNTNISGDDSLFVDLHTRLMDTATLTIRYLESYADTLHGFQLYLGIGRFNMPALNPIMEPIASARIRRGRLDTILMEAVGNEYRAYGQMKMYYRDLNVQFLNRNDYERKTILTRLANFGANTILRKANLKRSGFIYAERLRERGFPNYWIRITLNGILTNAGIRGSSRQERRLRKSLKAGQLPGPTLK
jgi:hypothetical protein